MSTQDQRSISTKRGFAPMRDFALLEKTKAFTLNSKRDVRVNLRNSSGIALSPSKQALIGLNKHF